MSQRWASLWTGPMLADGVEVKDQWGFTSMNSWCSTQLYALDREDRAWTLCRHWDNRVPVKWILVDDLVSGAAGRQCLAERNAVKEPDAA